ncbi:MAG: hypothetical protein QOF76_991 [Solirubrobacteraceae bacterium]|nr:hypothetical protein [Solirubrobacteraceae bacterium]
MTSDGPAIRCTTDTGRPARAPRRGRSPRRPRAPRFGRPATCRARWRSRRPARSLASSCRSRRCASAPSGSLRMTVPPAKNSRVTRERSLWRTSSPERADPGQAAACQSPSDTSAQPPTAADATPESSSRMRSNQRCSPGRRRCGGAEDRSIGMRGVHRGTRSYIPHFAEAAQSANEASTSMRSPRVSLRAPVRPGAGPSRAARSVRRERCAVRRFAPGCSRVRAERRWLRDRRLRV